ncbi:MAG: PDZ domain-containing protein [Deltaproteobacteria bacterium]|nr:MAG: PDZ domain-containing protein [Deltaproteobacteria bacterium]
MQHLRRSISQWRTARSVVLASIVLAGALATSVWTMGYPPHPTRHAVVVDVDGSLASLRSDRTVTYSGIGVAIRQSEHGSIYIERVFPNTPADGLLMPGMRIVAVDGRTIDGDIRDWTAAVRGAPGTDVELTVAYHCGGRQTVRLTRQVIRVSL